MKRKAARDGQLWWQEWAPHIPGKGRWIIVIGRSKKDNPTVHHALASRAGDTFVVDVTEHSLRPWEANDTLYRIDG